MKIHADFSKRVVVHSDKQPWISSPMKGVDRRPLDRIGGEVARATSIVRYAPGSHFSAHVHRGGEEFLVLDGVFQDEHGNYPAGTYVRNPPGTQHIPGSQEGCVIFVKLWQFEPDDKHQFSVNSNKETFMRDENYRHTQSLLLHEDEFEQVWIKKLSANDHFSVAAPNGAEMLVLSGEMTESNDVLEPYSWLRLPIGATLSIVAGSSGATFWLKLGNQQRIEQQVARVESAL